MCVLQYIYYTNMTSLWGCQHGFLPQISFVTRGRSPKVTMLTRGRLSCWQPHRDVIFVLLYQTHPTHGSYLQADTRRYPEYFCSIFAGCSGTFFIIGGLLKLHCQRDPENSK